MAAIAKKVHSINEKGQHVETVYYKPEFERTEDGVRLQPAQIRKAAKWLVFTYGTQWLSTITKCEFRIDDTRFCFKDFEEESMQAIVNDALYQRRRLEFFFNLPRDDY